MFRNIPALLGVFLIGTLLLWSHPVTAQDRWAAVASDDKAESPVVWADGREEAMHRALAACKRISKTCGDPPAVTSELSHIFTVMCCANPRHGCAIGVDATRDESLKQVQKVFDDAGFSSCRVLRHVSAGTGKTID
jgi:hypothetical protein